MKLLVIGSCTGKKDDAGCPNSAKLVESDFDDPIRLRSREAELRNWLRPAGAMYTGRQHTQMMQGLRLIRSTFGKDACTLTILSAGYGLIPEDRLIAPYDITFQGVPKPLVKARGEKLGVPSAIQKLVSDFPLVFFLLGDDYLRSARPPIVPTASQRFISFGSAKLRAAMRVVVIPTTDQMAQGVGDNPRTRKGRMFHLLAAGLQEEPSMLEELYRDNTPESVIRLMNSGKCLR